jgi:hypothetical protein
MDPNTSSADNNENNNRNKNKVNQQIIARLKAVIWNTKRAGTSQQQEGLGKWLVDTFETVAAAVVTDELESEEEVEERETCLSALTTALCALMPLCPQECFACLITFLSTSTKAVTSEGSSISLSPATSPPFSPALPAVSSFTPATKLHLMVLEGLSRLSSTPPAVAALIPRHLPRIVEWAQSTGVPGSQSVGAQIQNSPVAAGGIIGSPWSTYGLIILRCPCLVVVLFSCAIIGSLYGYICDCIHIVIIRSNLCQSADAAVAVVNSSDLVSFLIKVE